MDIHAKVEDGLQAMLVDPTVKAQIEHGINQQIRALLGVSMFNSTTFGPSSIQVKAEKA